MTKACKTCNGVGIVHFNGFTSIEGVKYEPYDRPCSSCRGKKTFEPVNEAEIRKRITATKGKNKGKLRSAMTSNMQDTDEARAYYVWRLARFHGGEDITMPMMADLGVRGDPFRNDLDKMAEMVAKESFGSDMHGALRWGRALGY